MKNRGFTLIELLAVIVILAAIALIVIPIVSDSIEKTRTKSTSKAIELYAQAVDEAILNSKLEEDLSIADGCYAINNNGNVCLDGACAGELYVDAKNKITSGTVCIEDKAVTGIESEGDAYGYDDNNSFVRAYKVVFNTNGGTTIQNQYVTPGRKIKKPNNPYKSGYKVKEWQLNNSAYDFDMPVTSDITLSVVWEETPLYVLKSGADFNLLIKKLTASVEMYYTVDSIHREDIYVQHVNFYPNGELPEGYTLEQLQALPSRVVSETGDTIKAYYDKSTKNLFIYSDGEIVWNEDSERMFYLFYHLKEFKIPEGVTSIDNYTFDGCPNLKSISIPETVTSIGDFAFAECKRLQNLIIPSSIASIGRGITADCTSLAAIKVSQSNLVYEDRDNNIIVEKASSKLIAGCKNSGIPNGIKEIGASAFSGQRELQSVIIPNSVTKIGESAFYDCRGITTLEIGSSVRSIGRIAFSYCIGLSSVTLPDSVTELGPAVFWGCHNLETINISNNLIEISEQAFGACDSLKAVVIPSSVTTIGRYAFDRDKSLTSITIPSNVTKIDHYAFVGCSNLTSITFESPNGWWYADTADATSGTSLNLSNPSTNATYLKTTYMNKFWRRN